MSALGNFITRQIERERAAGKDTTAASMAKRMKLKPSQLSRLINKPHPGCNRSTLENMCIGISDDKHVRAELEAAYLSDQRVGDFADLIEIAVRGRSARVKEKNEGYGTVTYQSLSNEAKRAQLDDQTTKALVQVIRAAAESARFQRSVRDLADIAKHDILGK